MMLVFWIFHKLHVLKFSDIFTESITSRGKYLTKFFWKFVRQIFCNTLQLLVCFSKGFLWLKLEFGTMTVPKFFKICFLFPMISGIIHQNLVYFQQLFTELEQFYQTRTLVRPCIHMSMERIKHMEFSRIQEL